MSDYDDFAAEYEGDDVSVFDDAAPEEGVLGEAPQLDDATWDSMLETAYEAPVADAGGGVDLLAEFAASITSLVDGLGEALDAFFGFESEGELDITDADGDGIADGFEEDDALDDEPIAQSVDLDGDGLPDDAVDEAIEAELAADPNDGYDDFSDA